VGHIVQAPGMTFGLARHDDASEAALTSGLGAGDKGLMWIDDEDNTIEFWDGAAAVALGGGGGGGITSLNGLTGSAQTLNVSVTSVASPTWNSTGLIHTLELPNAAIPGVTDGLISNSDYNKIQMSLSRFGTD